MALFAKVTESEVTSAIVSRFAEQMDAVTNTDVIVVG